MKRLFAPAAFGLVAARHLAWYLTYHVSGEPRSTHE
jgi:hypothetical protein